MRDTIDMAREAGVYQDCDWRYGMKAEGDSLKAFEALVRADERSVEREKFKHNEEVLMNALWKACGDDEEVVNATIESQGKLK
jgi:hypothetical protein